MTRSTPWLRAPRTLAALAVCGLLALPGAGCKRDAPPPSPAPSDTAPPAPRPAPPTAAPTEPAEPPPPPDTFVWTSPEPRAVDPALVGDATAAFVALNLFEGLLVAAPDDSAPRPGVAARYDVSADGRVWTFHLRADARWSDGAPVTADDFVFAWRRVLDPATGSPGAEDLWRLEHGRAFHEGRTAADAVGVRAVAPDLLSVTLERPDPLFAQELTSSRWLPVPARVVAAHGAEWTLPEHIVSNGAFLLESWAPRDRLALRKNPRHPEADTVRLARAVLRFTESEAVAARWYEAGLAHYTPGQVAFEKMVALQREGRSDLRLDPLLGVAYLVFNVRRPPFDDVRVRQAFDRAVDKAGLVAATLRGGQPAATHLLPEQYATTAGYEGPRGPAFDPDVARELLAAAGYPGGVGFPRVVLAYNTSDVLERMMTFVAAEWRRHLNVDVALEPQEWQSYLARVRAGAFDLARFGMQGGVDPADLLRVLRRDSPNNLGGWQNERFDALLDELRAESDHPTRLAGMAAAEQLAIEEAPILPLYFYTRPSLLHPSVRGFAPQARDVHLLRWLWLAP
jgi:oligopeptide transport system substrate-binding protein